MIASKEAEKKFRQERALGLGGSEASTAASVSKWGCIRALQYDKRSIAPDFPKEKTTAMERGTLMEPVARELYKERTGRTVLYDPNMLAVANSQHSFIRAHLDGIVIDKLNGGKKGVLEIKVPGRRRFAEFKRQGLDDDYIVQMQHNLLASGYSWGSFGILCLEPWDFLWFDVERDGGMIKDLIEIESEVWARIQNGPWYDRLDPKDRRCADCPWRKTCQGQAFVPAKEAGEFEPDDSLIQLFDRVKEADAIANEANDLKEEARNALKLALGDRQGAIVGGLPVYYREYAEIRLETTAINAEIKRDKMFAMLMAKYQKHSVKRPLRYFGAKD